ncbi:hypothetical protein AYO38_01430 [bacterium SCGC AG-212-C10]|nr:hypothetical protein AYO38_01430 [bacterium SCGC AG-212-C10]
MTAKAAAQGPANVYYGGQAVLEGVMIRGPEHMGVAVRHPHGHIVVHAEKLSSLYTGRARRLPLVRGMVVLWETMALGMRALAFSSKVALEGEEEADGEPAKFPESVFWGAIALSMVFVVGFFFAAPILLAHLLEFFDVHRIWIVAAEAVVRLGMFVAYIYFIGRVPDIRRVFQYHGAEHMTIHAYEAGRPLTVDGVRPFPKEHTRCGTSFLLVVIVVALIFFFTFDVLIDEGLIVRIASRIVFIPLVAAISYEILRFGARFGDHGAVKAMFAPNIALQALTTKVPDDSQIEVAIASFRAVLDSTMGIPPAELAEEKVALEAAPPLD